MTTEHEAGIRVRMYRVGFGDFFLLTLDDKHHIVIDCGVFKGTSGTGDIDTIEAAIANLATVTDKHLALIVMTHRHADHIAGFGRFADVFREFKVDAVWMPVWEDEYNPHAKKFQQELTDLAENLQRHLDLSLAANRTVDGELYHRLGNATGMEAVSATGKKPRGSNAIALDLLKNGLGVTPQYLQANDTPKLPPSLKAAGLSARVLGPPPVEDVDLMEMMDLKKHVGQYLAMAAETTQQRTRWVPFSSAWHDGDGAASYWDLSFTEWMPEHGIGLDRKQLAAAAPAARAKLERALLETNSLTETLELAAKKLDSFLNNQSLVILFTFSGKNLLFVGDAQAGNWEHWLYDTDDADKNPTGPLARRAREVLDSVDIYKVGHHGSTNATPVAVAESIREGSVALCSTQKGVYGKDDTAVPLPKLLESLGKRCTVVRSDQLAVEVDHEKIPTEVRAELPRKTDGKLEAGELWIDYIL
jgi:beta-lactamase superfamily II metal-dependent hydrolase